MRDPELGRVVRALRRRRGWRQEDCARRARLHRSTWSLLERGHLDRMTLSTVRRCLAVMDAQLDLTLRGVPGRDALLDEWHARLQAAWAKRLDRASWRCWPEHSFSHFGERGRVDLLAWHAPSRCLLVVEIKTRLVDAQDLLGTLDAKVRLAPVMARELGLPVPARVVRMIVFSESMTTRRAVQRLAPLFNGFELRGAAALAWLSQPQGGSGLLLFSRATGRRVSDSSPHRVRPRRARLSVGADPGSEATPTAGSESVSSAHHRSR